MHLIARVLRAAPLAALVALAAAAPAPAQTAVTLDAAVWYTPGAPADNALRLTMRVTDPTAAAPGLTERVTAYLPHGVVLGGDALPSCSISTLEASWLEGCPARSQVGSGRLLGLVGPLGAPLTWDAYLLNGPAQGELIVALEIANALRTAFSGRIGPSDDPAYGSAITLAIPAELRHPGGLDHAITELDLLLHAGAAGPYVAIAGCPLGTLPFTALLAFEQSAGNVPLRAGSTARCMTGPPPPVAALPRSAISPPDAAFPERAVAPFGVRLKRRHGEVRRLRLSGVAADARVSARCLRRCGRRGTELIAAVRGTRARLKRPLRAGGRFELRVGGDGLVTRFARYRVGRRAATLRRVATGCLDDEGAARACPGRS